MNIIHTEKAYQKRKMSKSTSSKCSTERKSAATKALHSTGAFLNTHVKRAVLEEFVDLYDNFLNQLFRSDEYEGGRFKSQWQYYYRIQSGDLEYKPLERLISDIKAGYGSMYQERALARLERDLY